MAAGLSKSQIDRLGLRLVGEGGPTEEDLGLLQDLLLERSLQLDRAEARVRDDLRVVPTSRVKNTETILEKLRRGDGSGLKSVQDLAGMRIVGDFDRGGQDELVDRIVKLFSGTGRAPKVIDRRVRPMHGYRAVHVVVFPEGAPIEIQVRTQWQHEWADYFEKLADLVGRGIRYGEPPLRVWEPADVSHEAREILADDYALREDIVAVSLGAADRIASVESAEAGGRVRPGDRDEVDELLARLRVALRGLDRLNRLISTVRP